MNQSTNILDKEIEAWDSYEYALREENRILFREMLHKCRKSEYIDVTQMPKARKSYIVTPFIL